MKKNKLLIALVSIISLGVVGCGETTPSNTFDPNNNELGYQWLDTSKPIVANKETVSFKVYSPKNALAENYKDMKVFQDLYDQTNVNINWENVTGTTYDQQKTLILANSSKWPDAIYHANFSNKELIQYGTSRNVITAIDKYLDYMPNLKGILEKRPDIRSAISSPDGHIYSLPRVEEMGLKQYPNLLFINKQWISKLIDDNKLSFTLNKDDLKDGLKLKRSQYKEILSKFKANDMNGNGKNDEIPLSFVHNNWQGNESDLIASFGIPENRDHKTIVNGKITFTIQDTKWKNAVSELHNWVSEGLIDLAAFEDTQDAFLAKGKRDSSGNVRLGSFYWWEMETVISKEDQSNYICLQPLVDDATNKQYVGVSNELEIEKGTCVIFEKCQNKEILLTYFDRFYDPYTSAQINYGPVGVVFEEELDSNGKLVTKELPEGVTTDELRLKNAPMGCIYLSDEQWQNNVNMEPRAALRLERLEKYAKPYTIENIETIPNLNYTLEEINTLARYETSLGTLINSTFMGWLLDGFTDSDWNDFQSKLTKGGIEEVKKINQDGYDRYLASQK